MTSRRAAEELIAEGRVRVNGKVVTELGSKADAARDHIKVDGKLINPHQPPTYIMLNKPAGFVTTMSDPEKRPTVQDLLKGVKARVYPVGRLDYNTEGLLILTNDGDFAHLITHPKHEFPKTYLAKVKGVLEERQIEMLEKGVFLQDGKTAPAKVRKIRKEEANSWVEITIHEGRKRQVRRMFDHVGRSVIKLKRTKTGSVSLGDLPEGRFRHLTLDEVNALRETAMKTDEKGQQVRVYKPAVKVQRTVEHAEPRAMDAARERPEFRASQTEHKGTRAGAGPRAMGGRQSQYGGQRTGESRVRRPGVRVMQDTREGLRKNQRSHAGEAGRPGPGYSRPSERKDVFPARTVSRARPEAGRPRPEGNRGAWPARTTRPEERGVRSRSANSQGERGYGAAAKPPARRPAPGAGSWKSESRSKPAARFSSRGPREGTSFEGRRPSSGPRPNKSTFTGGKRPARGARPDSRRRGQGAGKRGPRR